MSDNRHRAILQRSEAIKVENVCKSFGPVQALAGLTFSVRSGTVLGLLGPNGAGKTTLVRILTTLLAPDTGNAQVAGYDVVNDSAVLRSVIGLAGQYAAIDQILTGRENLEMVGRLYHLSNSDSRHRASELLNRFGLTDASDRMAKTYSGGMKRRLDLAASLVARPRVLFLDEPTAGLDPRSRMELWEVIRDLVNDGTTVLLTTQYMEEADQLANTIIIIDNGRIIAEGTGEELKARFGGNVLRLQLTDRTQLTLAAEALSSLGTELPQTFEKSGQISLPVREGTSVLAAAVRQLDAANVSIADIAFHRPSLDDVFLALTGRAIEDSAEEPTRSSEDKPCRFKDSDGR
jgi:ABC-2 type transport system ATP-binding protein